MESRNFRVRDLWEGKTMESYEAVFRVCGVKMEALGVVE